VFLGYLCVYFVFRENSYTSRTTPLALGSWWALAVFIFLPVVLIFRIINEESILLKNLPGYKDYCQKTHYRLIPFVW
jgi:protein-S-isoprenylcysteine O-methyltransferase Ste14